jgi:hypothetical protein
MFIFDDRPSSSSGLSVQEGSSNDDAIPTVSGTLKSSHPLISLDQDIKRVSLTHIVGGYIIIPITEVTKEHQDAMTSEEYRVSCLKISLIRLLSHRKHIQSFYERYQEYLSRA